MKLADWIYTQVGSQNSMYLTPKSLHNGSISFFHDVRNVSLWTWIGALCWVYLLLSGSLSYLHACPTSILVLLTNHMATGSSMEKPWWLTILFVKLSHIAAFLCPWRCQRAFVCLSYRQSLFTALRTRSWMLIHWGSLGLEKRT